MTGRAASAGSWFVALPDTEAAIAVADLLRPEADNEIRHPSGRPFVLGRWGRAAAARGRDIHVVAIGEVEPDLRYVDRVAAGGTAGTAAGSHHLLVSTGGTVRVRGTASGLRKIFHADLGGVTVASDRTDVLARLTGAEPDPTRLALRLLSPGAPWPLVWQSVRSGVVAVPPGHWLVLDSARHERWWTPPEPELSLADAGVALRDALDTAVAIRLQGKAKVACDLSGLDSSSLFGLAVRGAPVVALTYQADDPGDEDVAAAQYLVETCGTEHDVLPASAAPLPFQDLGHDFGLFDEPTWVSAYRARIGTASARAAAHHAELRFAGHGGDELLMPPPAWLADIARRHPVRAARLARRIQAKYRLPASALAAAVADRTSYSDWLATSLDQEQTKEWQVMSWGVPPSTPSWLTSDAVGLVRDAIGQVNSEPLADARGMHATLELAHTGAAAARHVAQLGEADGMPVAVPFFDDKVLEACLAVRPDEAIDPRRYKPQLVAAMTGVLPPRTLHRTSKSEISMTVDRGWSSHRGQILSLLDGSELGRLGLVDVAALRQICRGPYHADTCGPVRQALEVEAWLRSAKGER
ncbi:asparagine synthase-related protein [Kribbella sp. NPDC051952]|uniref:asparagine synthase-related protein n=1 Tax=Kribbella sp. NPDC051952 TaxID=3154851 RepID=UPI0034151613